MYIYTTLSLWSTVYKQRSTSTTLAETVLAERNREREIYTTLAETVLAERERERYIYVYINMYIYTTLSHLSTVYKQMSTSTTPFRNSSSRYICVYIHYVISFAHSVWTKPTFTTHCRTRFVLLYQSICYFLPCIHNLKKKSRTARTTTKNLAAPVALFCASELSN